MILTPVAKKCGAVFRRVNEDSKNIRTFQEELSSLGFTGRRIGSYDEIGDSPVAVVFAGATGGLTTSKDTSNICNTSVVGT